MIQSPILQKWRARDTLSEPAGVAGMHEDVCEQTPQVPVGSVTMPRYGNPMLETAGLAAELSRRIERPGMKRETIMNRRCALVLPVSGLR
ncbi:MAG: hypothetical protein ACK41X_05310 [Pseudorhodoplanes sp.]